MKKQFIFIVTIVLLIIYSITGCFEEKPDSSKKESNDISKFYGTWQKEQTEYESEYGLTATYSFCNNGSIKILYNVSYEDFEETQGGWGNYSVDGNKLCITAYDQDGCGIFEFSEGDTVLTLTDLETGEINSILIKQ